jgi:integrase/recombinase XerD
MMGERKPKRIYEPINEEQFLKLLKVTRKSLHRICFILAYGSGLRISEIVNLQPTDIDLAGHKIFIRQAKGSRDRIVNTPKWLREAHIKHFPIKIGIRAIRAAFQRNSFKAGFNETIYTDKKGVPRYRYHFHSLRAGFCIRALESGVPSNQVQLLMGHENLATTTRYSKANPTDAIQSILDKGV